MIYVFFYSRTIHLFNYFAIHLPTHSWIYFSPIFLFTYISFYLFIYVGLHLSTAYQSIYVSFNMFTCLPTFVYIYLSIFLIYLPVIIYSHSLYDLSLSVSICIIYLLVHPFIIFSFIPAVC